MKKIKITKDNALFLAYWVIILLILSKGWWLSPILAAILPQSISIEAVNNIKQSILNGLLVAGVGLFITLLITNSIALIRNRALIIPILSDFNTIISVAYYVFTAIFHKRMKNYQTALENITKAIQLKPADAKMQSYIYYFRGILFTYGDMKDFQAALADFNQAIELDQKTPAIYNNRGYIHRQLENVDAALSDFSKAIELNPKDQYAYRIRAEIYAQRENLDAALADLQVMIQLDPKNFEYFHNRGLVYVGMNDFSTALADFTQAIALNARNVASYYERGWVYHQLKNSAAALADYTKTIELNPKHEPAYCNRGQIFLELRDFPAAFADYSKAIELEPDDADPVYNMACLYALQLQTDEACSWLRRAMEMSAENVEQAKTDSDFDTIRNTPQFQALMDTFEK